MEDGFIRKVEVLGGPLLSLLLLLAKEKLLFEPG